MNRRNILTVGYFILNILGNKYKFTSLSTVRIFSGLNFLQKGVVEKSEIKLDRPIELI